MDNTGKDRRKLTLLCIGAHPADVFDHCGGTLGLHKKAGDRVVCASLTGGLRVHDTVLSEEFRERSLTEEEQKELTSIKAARKNNKEQEVINACACFGIPAEDVVFLGFDDSIIIEDYEEIRAVAQLIRTVKPQVIITHYPFENGGIASQHATTAKIVGHAIGLAGTTDYETNTPGWRITKLFYMIASPLTQTLGLLGSMTQPFIPIYVDITSVIDKKVEALNCMVSQQYGGRYAIRRTEVNEGTYGHHNRTGYCEAFVPSGPDLYDLLPVSEQHLNWAGEPEFETRKRGSNWIVPFLYETDENGVRKG